MIVGLGHIAEKPLERGIIIIRHVAEAHQDLRVGDSSQGFVGTDVPKGQRFVAFELFLERLERCQALLAERRRLEAAVVAEAARGRHDEHHRERGVSTAAIRQTALCCDVLTGLYS